VFIRMKPYVFADGSRRRGIVLKRMQDGQRPPPGRWYEAWRVTGGKWSESFGGMWLEKGDGKLVWEWL